MLFGNENIVSDHTQQFIKEEKQNSPYLFKRKLQEQLRRVQQSTINVWGCLNRSLFGELKCFLLNFPVEITEKSNFLINKMEAPIIWQ